MKQIIDKYPNGKIECKTYLNNLNQFNGLCIGYWNSGNICWKDNYINDKKFGLDNWYPDKNNAKPEQITYHL